MRLEPQVCFSFHDLYVLLMIFTGTVDYHTTTTMAASTNTNTAGSSLLLTTTTKASNTKKGPRDVNDDVSWATSMFFFKYQVSNDIFRYYLQRRRDDTATATSLLLTTTTKASITKKGLRDVNDDVSRATCMFFLSFLFY
jgi:hypothetical protein